jgi:RecJ-like exonuclease
MSSEEKDAAAEQDIHLIAPGDEASAEPSEHGGECPVCAGSGQVDGDACKRCGGSGRVPEAS